MLFTLSRMYLTNKYVRMTTQFVNILKILRKYAIPMGAILDFKVKSYVHEVANIFIEFLCLKNIFLCIKTLFIARLGENICAVLCFSKIVDRDFCKWGVPMFK